MADVRDLAASSSSVLSSFASRSKTIFSMSIVVNWAGTLRAIAIPIVVVMGAMMTHNSKTWSVSRAIELAVVAAACYRW